MRTNSRDRALVCGIALLGFCETAPAATFCVNDLFSLAAALNSAQNNSQDDEIRIEVGTYLFNGELDYNAAPSETFALTISGGWAAGCTGLASSGSSVLDGQQMGRLLYVAANGATTIRNLTFQHGQPTQYYGGALNISSNTADLILESSVFVNNHSAAGNAAGAVYMSTGGTMTLRSNLFIDNFGTGSSAAYLAGDFQGYVTGNTFVANQLPSHSGLGALDISGTSGPATGHFTLSNNILWNNDATDVYDQSGSTNYYNNDIGVRGGYTPLSETNDISIDPDFDGLLSVSLAPTSPLVNAGFDSAAGGIGAADAAGNARLQGKHVDIGAYESDVLFRDGFGG